MDDGLNEMENGERYLGMSRAWLGTVRHMGIPRYVSISQFLIYVTVPRRVHTLVSLLYITRQEEYHISHYPVNNIHQMLYNTTNRSNTHSSSILFIK